MSQISSLSTDTLISSVCWSAIHEKWFFLPRRVSPDKYDDKKDEQMGSNILLVADELFKSIEKRYIGPKIPTLGFSSFKFLPYSNDNIIGECGDFQCIKINFFVIK